MTDDPEVQLVNYQTCLEATVMDRAVIDIRRWAEQHVTARIEAHCAEHGLQMLGPILLDWTLRGAVRTRPATTEDSP